MKNKLKKIVDVILTVLLLLLMAYQVTGESLHEWLGVGMTVILIFHHILNRKWYGTLFKGRYNAYRIATILCNTLLLAAISLTAFCGMSMSNHAVPFLYGMADMVFVRQTHLAASFWSFILMGLHLGLHLPVLTATVKPGKVIRIVLTFLFTGLAGVGFWLFLENGIPDYIFWRTHFAFLDYEKAPALVFLENLATLSFFAFVGANMFRVLRCKKKPKQALIAVLCVLLAVGIAFGLHAHLPGETEAFSGWDTPSWEATQQTEPLPSQSPSTTEKPAFSDTEAPAHTTNPKMDPLLEVNDGFLLIPGGMFLMGSPETENWRSEDEKRCEVTVSAFYMDPYETTQADYSRLIEDNPSSYAGDDLPVENISWLDAVRYANAKSEDAGLTPAYTFTEDGVVWDRSANGYRLPTEAEWEYACRAGTVTPFNTETSISTEEANYWGSYPYEIEENYFNTSVLETKPGSYAGETLPVGSFAPNGFGLYDMHGNVNEWCWDYYGSYDTVETDNPTGPTSGTRHIYRGGGWNDFAKNLRSAYRAAGQSDLRYSNLGVRLVRNVDNAQTGTVTAAEIMPTGAQTGKILIVFFSWSGNTRGIAQEIQAQTDADIYEITLVHPYSTYYNTVLMEAQEDQHRQARPEIANPLPSIDEYDTILLGYPNWWASIPMPIATFLESYDFTGKTIIPFCSHGGGRFGQSLTAIAKLAPHAVMGEGLTINYSGGASMPDDVAAWLKANGIS